MKHIIRVAVAAVLLASACTGEKHFITDKAFREQVHRDYERRMAALWGEIPGQAGDDAKGKAGEAARGLTRESWALPEGMTVEEREALEFLYAYMPTADAADYRAGFYLRNVRAALRTREEMGWPVPEREFRHFVLPLRVNNESLDSARTVFYQELKPRIQGLSMQDAILEVNHWCHEKVTYQPSDARTLSPLNLVKNALGRCGEESTFTVTALRSVGIPARQVYTPRWAHTDDNHAWVEAWADGEWHFLGACEPEPVLDLGWFNAPASRAMLMHTKVFGKYDGPEEVVLESSNYTEVNLIDNYAKTARANFQILWADDAPDALAGQPAAGARVDFCIYNYAEFYPAVTKYANAEGRTFLSSGLGDMLVWASCDGAFGYAKVTFGKDTDVTVRLSRHSRLDRESLTIVPPAETANLPEVTPAQRDANNRRFAQEDSLRHAYEATFPAGDRARGNWRTIQAFRQKENKAKVEQVLAALSTKDLQDITPELLEDYYTAEPFLGARVENEFLTPFYTFFREHPLPVNSQKELIQWVLENIRIDDDPKAWNIPMSPEGVFRTRRASPRSRDIFFVDAARSLGFEARKDPVTGKVQYKADGDWLDVSFAPGDGRSVPAMTDSAPAVAPKGTLRLAFTPTRSLDNPKYYSHFTLSRIVDGRPQLLAFDEGEVDMGGGADWAHVFRGGYALDAGEYLLVSGNRLSDGSVPVSMCFFQLPAGETTTVDLVIEEPADGVPVIGNFDSESLFLPAGDGRSEPAMTNEPATANGPATSLLSRTGRGFYALAVLEPGKEPTNHVLRDLAAAREPLEAWGRPIMLLCEEASALERLQKEMEEGRYGQLPATVQLGLDIDGTIREQLTSNMKLTRPGRLPLVILADTFNRVFFCSEGYTIGLGEQLSVTISRL